MVHQFNSYRDFLNRVLSDRALKNPRYSLRAFARDLNMSPSRLCDVLKGKKGISVEAACGVAERLGLNETEKESFCDLVRLSQSRSSDVRKMLQRKIRLMGTPSPTNQIREDVLTVIKEWYNIAIYELVLTKDFKYDANWIANRLGISPLQAKLAIERLLRVELLKQTDDGKLLQSKSQVTTTVDIPSSAIREVNDELLKKASVALHTHPVEERDFSTMTMAINTARLTEAKTLISKFRREMAELLEAGDRDSVYSLTIQLFQLDRGLS